ncbi:hypothetical protein [Pseudoalteromonas luteoviolacea]|uniref:Lipoprotein n=1 Tax=Pseudoalteromonas luteoviolacea S4054 TaxID=1129367 RepID=A0A0F6AB50_9GAMM|nr:hypothetical protein [Pseudoalteromonas luteoviolacea]AOT08570.1 hypothetical protein S4054249_12230 [Pseudoalteromonas luteoviolacea]AOT13486.1 hypothetical protein S40542_12205 [Pseudoalteromonas luteoviolacea]AOT18399.1 hypothetical protein S4054_12205 [Pseudoalteromonas luteoviolacea]KKE83432.1 hypothetical protein N479_13760 [Pseudoalteromonas luteoviolacea S4054]KZN75869.1 hypothetical protein N481_05855 [Pseudoalteromonas luteoviolacea S4047-1]
MRVKFVLPIAIALNTTAVAATVIHDTDGEPGRVTYYGQAAINIMVTQSSSAYDVRVYTPHPASNIPCQSASIYSLNDHRFLTELEIHGKVITGQIPEGYENKEKYVELLCTNTEGSIEHIRHNIAPAPTIKLKSKLDAKRWLDGDQLYPGFYQDVRYRATLNIDNSESTGFCTASSIESDSPLRLQPWHNDGFLDDIISYDETVYYDARTGRIATQIICRNTGGTTRLIENWNIQQDNINHDIVITIN